MDVSMIETLISHGFTYEDLFKRGILTVAEPAAEPAAEPPAAEPPAAEPATAEPPAAEPPAAESPAAEPQAAGVTREDFDAFKTEIKALLQSTITQAATRAGKSSDEPTLMDTLFDLSERM